MILYVFEVLLVVSLPLCGVHRLSQLEARILLLEALVLNHLGIVVFIQMGVFIDLRLICLAE
jgi:hypothetical protein